MQPASPAQQLVGATLPNGWRVTSSRPININATGCRFSCGYYLENEHGHAAYLKAIDLSAAFSAPDPMARIQQETQLFTT
jgi:hypothetical protein